MTDRAERLGLETGSILLRLTTQELREGEALPVHEEEIAHSIAISLKRIADVLLRAEELAAAEVRGPNRSQS